ncbi:MAG: tetratricopeptide repeat protein [Bacteroidota bacterium]
MVPSKLLPSLLCLVFSFLAACQPAQTEKPKGETAEVQPVTTSLTGQDLYAPELSDAARTRLEGNLDSAYRNYVADSIREENIIWYGRRLAYLSRYPEAIAVYTRGLEQLPESFRLLRHRGHRWISMRDFARAEADLSRAAELAVGAPLEIEPDGIPNSLNQPLSNTHFNIYYHLGLARYLQGKWSEALEAYEQCMQYSDNPDLKVATLDWWYMTLRRAGQAAKADSVLALADTSWQIVENDAYFKRLKMYKGFSMPESLLEIADEEADSALAIATQGYGLANFYRVEGQQEEARRLTQKILSGTHWAAFGYIAAEADLHRDQTSEN